MRKLISPAACEFWFWMLLCGGLAAVVGMETDWGRSIRREAIPRTTATADFTPPELTPAFKIAPADEFLDIALRPLFVATRSPVPPPVDQIEPPKPKMKKGQFLLTGTMLGPDGQFAQLAEKASGKIHIVSGGGEINGMTVGEIGTTYVVLKLDDDSERISLRTSKAPTLAKDTSGSPPSEGGAAVTEPAAQRRAQRSGARIPFPGEAAKSVNDIAPEGTPLK